ncbi:MAG: threonine/serine dehydratase [Streptosporangiaceae bacterium]
MITDITPAAVASVTGQIRRYIRYTPVITIGRDSLGLDPGLLDPGPLALKLEQLQHTGSFKARGAFANLLLRTVPPAGVVAASGGNHGAAVAYAARALGVPAKIFVPEVSSPAKTARIRGYGADLVVGGASYAEALAASEDWAASSGALRVPAFDQPETILGAGSLAMELRQQVPGTAAVLAGVGGGGLLAGICAGYAGQAAIIGVEPAGAPTLTRALEAGQPVDAPVGSVAVDSLAPRRIGEHTFAVLRDAVREVVLVSDDDIRRAQELLWDRLRLVAEPGGCAALAAVLADRFRPGPGELATVVLSGANTTAVDFSR